VTLFHLHFKQRFISPNSIVGSFCLDSNCHQFIPSQIIRWFFLIISNRIYHDYLFGFPELTFPGEPEVPGVPESSRIPLSEIFLLLGNKMLMKHFASSSKSSNSEKLTQTFGDLFCLQTMDAETRYPLDTGAQY
jgi:hypothetical protein